MAAIEPNVSFGSAGRAVEQNSLESAYKPNNQPANPYFSYFLQRFLWMLECWTICQKRNGHFWTLLKERISNQSDGQVECIFIVQYIFSKLQCQNVSKMFYNVYLYKIIRLWERTVDRDKCVFFQRKGLQPIWWQSCFCTIDFSTSLTETRKNWVVNK